MSEQRFALIDHRLWAIEQRLSKVEYQLQQQTGVKAAPEARPAPQPQPVKPPPVVQQPVDTYVPPPQTPAFAPPGSPPYTPVQSKAAEPPGERDTEYMIGAKLLPKVG